MPYQLLEQVSAEWASKYVDERSVWEREAHM